MTRIAAVIVLESDDPIFTQLEAPDLRDLVRAVDAARLTYVWALMQPAEAAAMVSAHRRARESGRVAETLGLAFGRGHRLRRNPPEPR